MNGDFFKEMVAILFVFWLVVMAVDGARAENYAHLGAWSHHVASDTDYNETHNLAALEHNQIMAGYFKNSYGDDSFMAAYRFREPVTPHIELSLLAGASYGYRGDCMTQDASEPKSVCPLVAPAVTYTEYRGSLR